MRGRALLLSRVGDAALLEELVEAYGNKGNREHHDKNERGLLHPPAGVGVEGRRDFIPFGLGDVVRVVGPARVVPVLVVGQLRVISLHVVVLDDYA
jgi:hypothetical protein